jgi:hypothetical protein
MTVEIDLKPKRTPGGNTNKTVSQYLINKIDIIGQAFTLIRLQEIPTGILIMPRLVTGANFHGRKNVNNTGVGPSI